MRKDQGICVTNRDCLCLGALVGPHGLVSTTAYCKGYGPHKSLCDFLQTGQNRCVGPPSHDTPHSVGGTLRTKSGIRTRNRIYLSSQLCRCLFWVLATSTPRC